MIKRRGLKTEEQESLIKALSSNKHLLQFANYFANAKQPTNPRINDIDTDGFTLTCNHNSQQMKRVMKRKKSELSSTGQLQACMIFRNVTKNC